MDDMDDMTEDQRRVVDELRRRTIDFVTPKLMEDASLFYRFARARDFDLVEAEHMLKKHIAWAKEMQIDTILTDYEPPEVLVKFIPMSTLCVGRDGSLVRHIDCAGVDMKGLWNVTTPAELLKYAVHVIESDKEASIKQGRNLGKPLYSAVYEFENIPYAAAMNVKTVQFIFDSLKMFMNNYPEMIRRAIVINAPAYLGWFFNACKKILPDTIIQKAQIHGKDGWKENLLEFIDVNDLPVCLGGNKTDPDGNPLCKTIIHRGCTIPKSYYMRKRVKKLYKDPNVEKVTIAAFSKEEITFQVKDENSIIEWEFETKQRDINFSLLFIEEFSEDFQRIEIIPLHRIDTSFEPEKGGFRCERVGKYTFVFDNSFSWFHSKEVYYRVEIRAKKTF